jgi:hypothetical protein
MIVEMEKAETSSISSKMSDTSEKNMFITATKTKKEKIDNTEAAIQALEIYQAKKKGLEVPETAVVPVDKFG